MCFCLNLECKCCRDKLWHCETCWDKYHNGLKHKDYIQPSHYGQSMLKDRTKEKMREMGIEINPTIKEDKNREYKEGEYH